jgi:hypothetical protein
MNTIEWKQRLAFTHWKEWHQNVSLEVKNQQATEQRYCRERDELTINEINFHERDQLIVCQLQELKLLKNQNIKTRQDIRLRQQRELESI